MYSAFPGTNPQLEEQCQTLGIEVKVASGRWMRNRIVFQHLRHCRLVLACGVRNRFKRSPSIRQILKNHYHVMEQHINPKYLSNLIKRVQLDHQKDPFVSISGFHAVLLPSLYTMKQELDVPVNYTEISSPKYRFECGGTDLNATAQSINALDNVIVPSPRIEVELQKYCGLNHSAIVIPFATELPQYEYSPPVQGARTYGIIARLSREKNQDILIRSLPLVRDRIPDARLILIGTGPQSSEYHSLAQQMGVDRSIEWISSFTKLEQVIEKIDIVTLISDAEGMPLTIIEALYFGKPIIATAVGSIPDMVVPGENGYLVEKDMAELADRIIQIMSNPDLARSMSLSSREIFTRDFSKDGVARQILEVYTDGI